MDNYERYYQLSLLGRDAFLKSVAPAALVRKRRPGDMRPPERTERDLRSTYAEDTLLARIDTHLMAGSEGHLYEIFPLAKKTGAPFANMITVGRTANNDVVLKDITVSRFHAFFRQREGGWIVCDADSKNGTFLAETQLQPRQEVALSAGDNVRIGDIATTFYTAPELFELLTAK